MNDTLRFIITAAVAYLLGSLSFSIIISKLLFKTDIREHGSGNAGTTNALRVFGPVSGAAVLAGDFLKGVLAVYLGKFVFFGREYMLAALIAGIFVILGHVYPVFFRFKGGKGVATAAGLVLVIDLKVFITVVAVFAIVLIISKYVSLSSICAAVSFPISTYLFNRGDEQILLLTLIALCIGSFVIYGHRTNIKRLLNGTEPKLGMKKKE